MDLWDSVVRMGSALAVVLAVIVALLGVARSSFGRRWLQVSGTPLVKILGCGQIGARKQVMVVAVAGEVLIVGTTATDLIPLGKVTDPEQLRKLLAEPPAVGGLPLSGDGSSREGQEGGYVSQ
ncbi:hypothetical protein FBQ96_05630 [Nitrospirales bacterium NOB]|nr:MAG: putative flagellar biosynthetic protein FliO, export component [Nitrospira sp. OLB3]MBV6470517.1 hypothetical protein [Nitrospirota bacterium]MCE7965674.1 hypothetical protein [Nitrospira sp. NTP2]MCK6494057.1 flagellar biosynthetic protein FliO [Nitrospira sp.]MDL1889051.1 hypothetical protein [Nitrospirales bacterium NOB]MEB2338577.1 flagellar biosynthetic protein FliO [Nitrospirales bacterium]